MTHTASPQQNRRDPGRIVIVLSACLFALAVVAACTYPYLGRMQYTPQEGDIVFQSLPLTPLVSAIERGTDSPFSHCGIVAKDDGRWVVYEAYSKVEQTPLTEFLQRGRNYAFAVYRVKPEFQKKVPAFLQAARQYVGKPYDSRYRMDDDAIYCSELVYKSFHAATGEKPGRLVALRALRWRAHRELIEQIEGGPVPLDRQMITPKHLSQASQLQSTFSYGYGSADLD